jgi:hypothetical protein
MLATAAAGPPLALTGDPTAVARLGPAQGFEQAAPSSPVRVGSRDSGAPSPRTRNHRPEPPGLQDPSGQGATSNGSTGSSSSAASGGSGSGSGTPCMIVFSALGLAGWALYKLLISAARWRSVTLISLLERPG